MSDQPRLSATPPGVRLCALDEIAPGAARGFVLQMRDGRFFGFVVRAGQEARGYVDRCPHAGLPLARALDDYLTLDGSLIACSWHGALFTVADGACVGGPCAGQRLTEWAVAVAANWIVTAEPSRNRETSPNRN